MIFDFLRNLHNLIVAIIAWLRNPSIRLLPSSTDDAPSSSAAPERNVPDARPVEVSRVTMTEIVTPTHADTRGFIYGGEVIGWIDLAAGISAKKHAVYPCVTRSVDAVHFMHPIKVGDLLVIQASVNRAWNTSMEVGVRVETENPLTGKRKYCCHAYLTFVALLPSVSATPSSLSAILLRYRTETVRVPKINTTTAIEVQRHAKAEERRQARISSSKITDARGRREQTKLAELRELMREWSKTTNVESMSSAEVPPLIPEEMIEEISSETNENEENEEKKDPARLFLRRKSTFSGNLPEQPREKLMRESFAEVVETVLPQHANTLQITFGGQIMKWMEQCSLISATRHARRFLLLASIDSLQFLRPAYVGDCVTVRSIVSCTFHSSLEVYVTVEAENLFTGERYFTNDGFVTMVAVDFTNNPTPVPRAIPQQAEEFAIRENAEERRRRRLWQRRELVQKELSTSPDEFIKFAEQ
ncbi:4933_t:CDS:10 [Paraglomus occultum]|uniref:4933_t:CDS:1 n=1 Tax=Paraglomus occultum TaxID=144539 RepID=A0A9N8Z240_9GLOM|nr:4933_t:CDS:10 [Paraglomus occultum]